MTWDQAPKVTKLVSGEPVIPIQICDFTLVFFPFISSVGDEAAFKLFLMLLQSVRSFGELAINTFYVFLYIRLHSLMHSFNKYLLSAYYISRTVLQSGFKWPEKTPWSYVTYILLFVYVQILYMKDLASYSNMHIFPLGISSFFQVICSCLK